MPELSPRDRVRTALARRVPDRVPKIAGFTPAVQEAFERATGADDPAAYFGWEVRGVGFRGPEALGNFSAYHPDLPAGASCTEYGVAHVPGSFHHFTRMRHPLAGATSLAELEAYPWPDLTPAYRHAHLEAEVEAWHRAGFYVQGGVGHIYEDAWQITSMPKLLTDFVQAPAQAAYVLDRITEDRLFMARRLAEARCDGLGTGDDVGMQDRMMMSPATWRQWFRPRWARVFRAAKEVNPDLQIMYHSDGMIEPIIPDLLEIGLDVLNPVQPECMDPAALKRQYGDRLAFWGTIGTQTTMPFGTPDEVRRVVRERVETVGAGGGLLIAPTHVLEPDVPWANVVALFEAVEEYGVYR